jgi:hypothetical protein
MRGWVALLLVLGLARGASAEDLDLTRVRYLDWAAVEAGREARAQALLAPTEDPKELAGLLKKAFGARLASDDNGHWFVFAAGQVQSKAVLRLQNATVDRFMHLIEVQVELETPEKSLQAKPAPKAQEEELVIGPAVAAAKAGPLDNAGFTADPGQNPALFLALGRLSQGQWWLRVHLYMKNGDKSEERPLLAQSFNIKDNRPAHVKNREGPDLGIPSFMTPQGHGLNMSPNGGGLNLGQ